MDKACFYFVLDSFASDSLLSKLQTQWRLYSVLKAVEYEAEKKELGVVRREEKYPHKWVCI